MFILDRKSEGEKETEKNGEKNFNWFYVNEGSETWLYPNYGSDTYTKHV